MTAMTARMFLMIQLGHTIWMLIPHKYPIFGKTRIRTRSYVQGKVDTGTIVSPEYEFIHPLEKGIGQYKPNSGTYLRMDARWGHTTVKFDHSDELEQHGTGGEMEWLSDYRTGIPAFCGAKFVPMMRSVPRTYVGPLPYPIEFFMGDTVIIPTDPTRSHRKIINTWFNRDGRPAYTVGQTLEEQRTKPVYNNGAYYIHHAVPKDWQLVSRGNYYQLIHGKPVDLVFPHPILEVDFWKDLGIWQTDSRGSEFYREPDSEKPEKAFMIHQARQYLIDGLIDVSIQSGQKGVWTPICLPDHLAQFRPRARAVSLECLERYPGKYSFEVVDREIHAEYTGKDRGF